MNPYVIIATMLAWGASIAGTAHYFTGVGEAKVTAFNAKAEQVVRETREAAQQGAATAIAANRPKNVTNVQEVRRETDTKIVYRECANTAVSMHGINAALTGQRPDAPGGSELPNAVPVD